jgi:ParB family transcriptional regulator, chromosome partitioning protein
MGTRAQVNLTYVNDAKDLNIRKEYGDLADLKASISTIGVQVPIRVVEVADPAENGGMKYRLDDGFRRVAACRELIDAGVTNAGTGDSIEFIEATVIDASIGRIELLRQQMAINCIRKNLTVLEEAGTIRELLDLGETFEAIQKQFGLKKMAIDQRLKLLEAPEDIKNAVQTRLLEFSAARALQRVTDDSEREELLEKAVEEKLSTREVEGLITSAADKAEAEGRSIKKRRKRSKAEAGVSQKTRGYSEVLAHLADCQEDLSAASDELLVAKLQGRVLALQWVVTLDSATTVVT